MHLRPILSALRHNKTGAVLIALQVALTLAIVSNALSIIRERLALAERPTGVEAEAQVLAERPILFNPVAIAPLIEADLAGLRALPGVVSVALSNQVPLGRSGWGWSVTNERSETARGHGSAMYFDGGGLRETLGLRLIEGRDFRPDEVQEIDPEREGQFARVAIISEALARQLFPDADHYVGREIYLGAGPEADPLEVVGVVEQLTSPWGQRSEANALSLMIPVRYLNPFNYYVLRVMPGQEAAVREAMSAVLLENAPERVSQGVVSLAEFRDKRYRGERAVAWLLVAVTVFLMLVTASGIVGMASLWVNLRRKQIGVRRALGATRGDILRYFVAENLMITGTGVALGVLGAWLLNGVLVRELAMPTLPWGQLAAGGIVLLLLGVIAVLGPALRAAALSPALATRSI